MKHLAAVLMMSGLAACAVSDITGPFEGQSAEADTAAEQASLQPILEEHWALTMSENPTWATTLGVRDYDTKLGDPSLVAYERGIRSRQALLRKLEALDPATLDEDDALNRELLILELEKEVEAAEFGGKYMIITNRGGPHLTLTSLPERLPFRTEADYQSYVTRLEQIPAYLDAATARLKTGIEEGWVQPCAAMEGYEDSINVHIVIDPEDSVFLDPFDMRPSAVSDRVFTTLRTEAAQTIRDDVVPAFREFETFYNLEYQPACREEVGTSTMPGGDAYYEHRVQLFTTTDLTADEIHEIGLREVSRIREEMKEVATEANYRSLEAYQRHLRTNRKYYPRTAEERIAVASTIAKRMDGQLVNLFTYLPRMPYDIREIPLDIAEKTTTAYYSQPAGDGSRPGTYWLNTTKLNTRPLYELEALTLHEAVPGHHLQIAIAQELDLPNFRRYGGFTAFVEGWGLYAERLGLEVGFYDTPATNFGRLSYEMWRASRLVVDTGMHSKGWSRQQAIDFMVENTGLSLNNITTEVDRYITWPGQALAYKIGELKIRELRARAEERLGPSFDVRLFHDEVLEAGAVPLSVLEARIDRWIEEQAGATAL
jgi:uncharacterized protein (DUF885 family)